MEINRLADITPEFIKAQAAKIEEGNISKILASPDFIKAELQNSESLNRFVKDFDIIIFLLQDYMNKKYTTISFEAVQILAYALDYIVDPVDIIPDNIAGIGHMDDEIIFSLSLKLTKEDLEKYKKWKLG